MRRLLHTLARLGSPARRARRAAPGARPGLEVLERREVPTGLSVSPFVVKYPNLAVANLSSVSTITQPGPSMLAGKSVTLAQPGTPSNAYGVLKITSVSPQSDGSYTFTGTYQTSLYSVKDMMVMGQPAVITVSGTLGAPQYSHFYAATCSIYIDTSAAVWWNGQMVYEHIHYTGTVSLTTSQLSVSGNLYDCLEDGSGDQIIPCSTPAASGTFA